MEVEARGLFMTRLGIVALLVACAAVLSAAQDPAGTQRPTFRAATEVVAVDVSVVDREGAPVKNLTADEFVVKVDGQPRRIVSLQFVDQAVREAAAATRALPLRPVVSSNAMGGGGRLVLIVVDEASIKFGGLRAAVQSAERLLKGFGPADRVGLAALPGPRMLVDFGRDRQRIIDALKRIPAGASASLRSMATHNLSVSEAYAFGSSGGGDATLAQDVLKRECGNLTGLDAMACQEEVKAEARQLVMEVQNDLAQFSGGLRSLLQALAANDVPKIVILFSEGLLAREAASELSWVGSDAAAARTVIHTLRLERNMFDASLRNPRMDAFFDERGYAITSLDTLSGASRGLSLEIVTSSQGPFDRLAREVSGFYLLGVEPQDTERDGKHHRIQVQCLRPGVTVRARPDFTVPATRANAVVDEAKVLLRTMQSPMLSTDIPLRVATFNMADDDPAKVRVMVTAEIDRQQDSDGRAQIGYAIYDDKGKPFAGFTDAADLKRLESGALGFVAVSAVPAGTYTLKLAAVREGRAGSVEHGFTARLTPAPPLRLGDLVISDPPPKGGRMLPSLDAHVLGDAILGFMQLRTDRELPKDAQIVLEVVKSEEGRALIATRLSIGASTSNVRVAQGMLDGRVLPPGQYGARATVTASGKPIAKLYTEFSLERTVRTEASASAIPLAVGPAPFAPEDVLTPSVVAAFLDQAPAPSSENMRAAVARAKEGRFEEAAAKLGTGAGKNDPTPAFIRGLALYKQGQLVTASEAFRDSIGAAPDFIVGIFYMGACYAARGNDQRAITAWQTSLVGLEQFPVVYRLLVDALLRRGEAARAEELLQEAAGRWPADDGFQLQAARVAAAVGRYEEVLQYLDRQGSRTPKDSSLLFLAMHALFQRALDSKDTPPPEVLERIAQYRDLYAAAKGPYQPLVAEWVAFIEQRSKRTR